MAMKKIGLLKRLARKKGGLKYDPYGFQLIEWPGITGEGVGGW